MSTIKEDNSNEKAKEIKILRDKLSKLNILLSTPSGNISYNNNFKPFKLNFDLVFVRHGETYGNAGQTTIMGKIDEIAVKNEIRDSNKRIFQGDVDFDINQLTKRGKVQGQYVAQRIKSELLDKGWQADIILASPLKRAIDTAHLLINKYDLKFRIHEGLREMSFGGWDNRRVCDFDATNNCHLLYLKQNTLVKENGINGSGQMETGENFCELLLRAQQVLRELNEKFFAKKVIMFSHSMFGAACAILLGKGAFIENSHYLAFDGTRDDGTPYTLPHAMPINLGSSISMMDRK